MKKIILPILAAVLFFMALVHGTSCTGESASRCTDCDTIRMMLDEYIVRDSMKSALLASYDEHLSRFGNIQDSINMYKRAIDSLKLIIRRKGPFKGNESAELQKYISQINDLVAKNKELAQQMEAQGIKNQSMDNLIKLMYTNLEVNQNALAETRNEVEALKVEVKELGRKVEDLKIENVTLTQQVEEATAESKRIRGVVRVVPPKERKAKKIQSLQLSFVLESNMQARQGSIPVYFRILDPTGRVLDPHGEFRYEGSNIAYTLKSFINYTGKSARSQIEWNKSHVVLEPGTYTVDFYIDDYKGISDQFTLEK